MSKNRHSKSNFDYSAAKAELSAIHRFGFRHTKHFNRGQKAEIKKKWNEYKEVLSDIKKKNATFVKATPKQIEKLQSKQKTNKGVILNEKVQNVRVRGKGKNTRIEMDRGPYRKEIYIPMPPNYDPIAFIDNLLKGIDPQPSSVSIEYHGYRGSEAYQADRVVWYLEQLLTNKIPNRKWKKTYKGDDISGFYLVWSNF